MGNLRQENQGKAKQCEWSAAGLHETKCYPPSPPAQGHSESKELKTNHLERMQRERKG